MGILQFWFYFTNLAEEWAPWPSTQVVPSPWPPHAPDLLWLTWYLTVLSSATSIHPPHFYVLWQPLAPVLSLLVSALSASALLQLLVLSLFCKKTMLVPKFSYSLLFYRKFIPMQHSSVPEMWLIGLKEIMGLYSLVFTLLPRHSFSSHLCHGTLCIPTSFCNPE